MRTRRIDIPDLSSSESALISLLRTYAVLAEGIPVPVGLATQVETQRLFTDVLGHRIPQTGGPEEGHTDESGVLNDTRTGERSSNGAFTLHHDPTASGHILSTLRDEKGLGQVVSGESPRVGFPVIHGPLRGGADGDQQLDTRHWKRHPVQDEAGHLRRSNPYRLLDHEAVHAFKSAGRGGKEREDEDDVPIRRSRAVSWQIGRLPKTSTQIRRGRPDLLLLCMTTMHRRAVETEDDVKPATMAYFVKMLTLEADQRVLRRLAGPDLHVFVVHEMCQSDLLRLRIELARLAPYQSVSG